MADHFAHKAEDWDRRERVRLLSEAIGTAITENVMLDEHMEVLDFGAGTGLVSERVAPRVGRIVAVDTSAAMLEQLTAKPALAAKVEPVCRDITVAPLARRFDLIISAMALHHVEDTRALMARFAEHLKPGGRVALADLDAEDGSFHPPDTEGVYHHGFERAQLERLMAAAGFTDIRFTTAHTVRGEGGDYPIFLVTARRG